MAISSDSKAGQLTQSNPAYCYLYLSIKKNPNMQIDMKNEKIYT